MDSTLIFLGPVGSAAAVSLARGVMDEVRPDPTFAHAWPL